MKSRNIEILWKKGGRQTNINRTEEKLLLIENLLKEDFRESSVV